MAKTNPSKSSSERRQRRLKSAVSIDQSKVDRVAVWITDLFGSMVFLSFFMLAMVIYVLCNLNIFPGLKAFDKYPFDGLNTVLTLFAVILSVSVLISQNRQRKREKIREQVEFEVNVRAESEITKMLGMLHAIQQKLHIDKPDQELEEMKQTLDLEQLHEEAKEDKNKI